METIISDHILKQRMNSKKYYELLKEHKKQKYQENKEVMKQKSLEYYTNKYNNDPDFKEKRKEYMREYQRKKREARSI